MISETDKTDNTGVLQAFGPDLAITGASVDYWGGSSVGLKTHISNLGTTSLPSTTLNFYRGALTGTLAVTDIVPMLAAGQSLTLTTPWDFGSLGAGDYALVAVVNPNQTDFTETFTANNVFTLPLSVRADVAVSPYYLWMSAPVAPSVLITATVFNVGPITATNVAVGFYTRSQLLAGTASYTATIPVLAPGSAAMVVGQLSGPIGQTVYVLADPNHALIETTGANNLASLTPSFSIFLPLIER